MNTEQEIQNLKKQVAELVQWKEQRTRQQLVKPLDTVTKNVLLEEGFIQFEKEVFLGGGGRVVFVNYNKIQGAFRVYRPLKLYQVDPATDRITLINHGLLDDQLLIFYSTGVAPSPIVAGNYYYVCNSTANTFQISINPGGIPIIDITDSGTGDQYVQPVIF